MLAKSFSYPSGSLEPVRISGFCSVKITPGIYNAS